MIYSPSRTEAYDFCSLRGKLAYTDGWIKREADNGLIGRIVGSGFAKASEIVHKGGTAIDAAKVGIDLINASINHYVKYGVTFPDLGPTLTKFTSAVEKYTEANPFTRWTVQGLEFPLPAYGNCRLDVVGVDPEGYQAIADIKFKRQLKLDYLTKTVNEYKDSWQFQHYPWAWNDWIHTMTPTDTEGFKPCDRMWLVLVIADPFRVLTYPFFVQQKLQTRWIISAQQKWADIQAIQSGERLPVMSATHRDAYGECPFKRACLELDLDEGLMNFEYTKVPKMEDPA
jgi:hypothetical protein